MQDVYEMKGLKYQKIRSLHHQLLPDWCVWITLFCKQSRGKRLGLSADGGQFSERIFKGRLYHPSTQTLKREENVWILTRTGSVSRRTLQVSFTVSFFYGFCFQFCKEISYPDPCWSKLDLLFLLNLLSNKKWSQIYLKNIENSFS